LEWERFLKQQIGGKPLLFAHGMRHPARVRTYCPRHRHSALEIVYHPVGKGVTQVDDGEIRFDEGSVVIYAPRQEHDQRMEKDGEDLCLKIETAPGSPTFPPHSLYVPHVNSPAVLEDIRALAEGDTGETATQKGIFDLRATVILLTLLSEALEAWKQEKTSRTERYILQIEAYMRENFHKMESLADLSREIGISPDHLRHLFKASRGKSLIRRLNELRIARAKALLVHSQLSLKQIATLCGFKDEYYFSVVFKKLTLTAPGYYRKMVS